MLYNFTQANPTVPRINMYSLVSVFAFERSAPTAEMCMLQFEFGEGITVVGNWVTQRRTNYQCRVPIMSNCIAMPSDEVDVAPMLRTHFDWGLPAAIASAHDGRLNYCCRDSVENRSAELRVVQ